MIAPSVPPLPLWESSPWHARARWAAQHRLSVTAADRRVRQVNLARRTRAARDAAAEASMAADRDPLVVAMRRAVATGLPVTHPDVQRGLPC